MCRSRQVQYEEKELDLSEIPDLRISCTIIRAAAMDLTLMFLTLVIKTASSGAMVSSSRNR